MDPRPQTHGAAGDQSTSQRLVIAAMAVAILVCALMTYWLWVLRDHRLQFADRQVLLQTTAVAEHARVVFNAVDASMRATVVDLEDGRIDSSSADRSLRWRSSGNLYLRELALARTDGSVLASSLRQASAPMKAMDSNGETSLHISSATAASGSAPDAIELSRAVPRAPQGVAQVAAIVDQRFIAKFFARIEAADDARFGLFSLDGTRLAGELDPARLWPDSKEGPAATLARLLAVEAPHDAGQAFAAAQRLRDLPLVVVTSRSRGVVLAPWYEYVVSASVATVLALSLLALFVRHLQRETRARQHAQAALARTGEQARRLEALGRLSGGIAHDFNNVLAAILGYGELLQRQLPADSAAARNAEQVVRAGERGRRLVARILAFSRGGMRVHVPIAAEPVVAEAVDLLAAGAAASVRIERRFEAPQAVMQGDATQLFEAVGNLCSNALDAMRQGGLLRVGVAVHRAASIEAVSHGSLHAGAHVAISVQDSGAGLAADAQEHLFEPFYTTRAASGGTGLGLAMVHGAVHDMGGAIDVRSAPGQGTRFTLYFPLADTQAPAEERSDAPAPRGTGQVVMVVDDEPALVSLTEEVLAGLGYEAVGFCDPALALAVMRESPERFDALLVDQVMPQLPGTTLAQHFRALRPDAPVLLATGFGGPNLEARARDAGVSVLLQKPLRRGELALQLARVLTSR